MAITNVDSNDRSSLNKLVESVKANYNERGEEIKRHWGGGSLGNKSAAKVAKVEKIKAKELDEVNNLGDEIEEEEDTDDNITVF
jgi:large subunit ribosomal protein L7Ae